MKLQLYNQKTHGEQKSTLFPTTVTTAASIYCYDIDHVRHCRELWIVVVRKVVVVALIVSLQTTTRILACVVIRFVALLPFGFIKVVQTALSAK